MPEQKLVGRLDLYDRVNSWRDQGGWEWSWDSATESWIGVSPTDDSVTDTATMDELNSPGFGPFREVKW